MLLCFFRGHTNPKLFWRYLTDRHIYLRGQGMSETEGPRPAREDPIIAQRRLRTTLRKLRLEPEDRKQTQKQVAEALDWSPSKLMRLESGQTPVTAAELLALLSYYRVTERSRIDELTELARVSRKNAPLRDTYRDIFSREFAEFVQHEAYASDIREFETKLIPGLLQLEDYAEAVIRSYLGSDPDEAEVMRRVQARLERSAYLLDRADGGPSMTFIIDEAVVRRCVGWEADNRTLMIKQLERLKELNARPKIKIYIVPFELGMYSALRGPFEILEFADLEDEDLLYLENPLGDELIHEDFGAIEPYIDAFTALEATLAAITGLTFDEKIDVIIQEMKAAKSIKSHSP
jgi:transcriptional regulator with XRE-family HTH domain